MGVFHPHHSGFAPWGYGVLHIDCSGSVTNTAYCTALLDIYIVLTLVTSGVVLSSVSNVDKIIERNCDSEHSLWLLVVSHLVL